jgi:hypothetical protein
VPLGRQTDRQEDNKRVEAKYRKIGSDSSGLPGTRPDGSPRTPVAVEGVAHGMLRVLGGHEPGVHVGEAHHVGRVERHRRSPFDDLLAEPDAPVLT